MLTGNRGYRLFWLLSVIIQFIGHTGSSQPVTRSVEQDLISVLLSQYEVSARPVNDSHNNVPVQLGLGLQQIIDLDEPSQILTTSIFMRIFWKDVALSWRPEDYNDTTSVRLDIRRIWRPDITLYNDVSTNRRQAEILYPAIVSYDGSVAWLTPSMFYSSCPLDLRYFPWDSQVCMMELGSWTYDASAISLSIFGDGGDTGLYIENGAWTLLGMPAFVRSMVYPCCAHPYETIIFNIKLTRKPMFYVINIVLPCIFISFVGLLVFVLPPDSGEKVSLSVTVLLACTVFLLMVADMLPPQSTTVPLVSQYFECVIGLLAVSTIVTVLVINVHHRNGVYPSPPRFMRYVLLDILPRLLCMQALIKSKSVYHEDLEVITSKIIIEKSATQNHSLNKEKFSSAENQANGSTPSTNGKTTVKFIGDQDKKHGGNKDEWLLIAMVLDRLFLIIFLVLTIVTTATILLQKNFE